MFPTKKNISALVAAQIKDIPNNDLSTIYAGHDTQEDKDIYKRILENRAWYSSDEQRLRNFYKQVAPRFNTGGGYQNDDRNFFWSNAPNEIRKINSGFATDISDTMANIIFSNGYQVNGLNDADKERLDLINKDNKTILLLQGGAVTESWSGIAVAKIIVDEKFTKYPIIEFVEPENVKFKEKYKRVVEYTFINKKYISDKKEYFIYEIYGWNKVEGATIDYKCVYYDKHGNECESDLSEEYKRQTFPDIDRPLAFFKPNKTPNNEVMGSVYGSSDYAGIQGELDALDEMVSIWTDDLRNGRTIFAIPEDLLGKNLNGENDPYNRFMNNTIKTKLITDEDNKPANIKIEKLNPEVDIDKYINSAKEFVSMILRNSGLSPVTLGINGEVGANASSKARRDMERQTVKTRNMKVKLWQPFMQEMFDILLQVDDMINNRTVGKYETNVTINPYIDSDIEERLEVASKVREGSAMSVEESVDYIYRNTKTEEEKTIEVNRLNNENNIQTTNDK